MNPRVVQDCWLVLERDGERRVMHWLELTDNVIAVGWEVVEGIRAYSRAEAVKLAGCP